MNYKLKLSCFFLLLSGVVFCQNGTSVSILAGPTSKDLKSLEGRLNLSYSSNKNIYEITLSHSIFKEDTYVPVEYSSTLLELGYLYKALNISRNLMFLSFGGGTFGGYEIIKKVPEVIIISENGIVYGLYAAAQIDFYLSNKIDLIIRGQENYYLESQTGNMNPYLGIGIKINF